MSGAPFDGDGFSATAVDESCARADVTRGAFHHHFSSKKHIFREVYAISMTVRQAFLARQDPWDGMAAGGETSSCPRLSRARRCPAPNRDDRGRRLVGLLIGAHRPRGAVPSGVARAPCGSPPSGSPRSSAGSAG
ncbi:helix-turn-helix domain-containing protein [Streptosporangium sp. NPDC000239]|uniref:helix-turn-helix domain-containing protein n=1 Tax=Streptosporangium sp. NPDC000239 TaxID=3154248 RepID=UPI0033263F4A